MTKATKHRLPGICCPHCLQPATQRKANIITPMVRDIYFRCENDDCGHQFVVQMAIIRTVVASRTPNQAVRLPFSARSLQPPANDDHPIGAILTGAFPPPANDLADEVGTMTG